MRLHEPLDDGKTKAEPSVTASRPTLLLAERLEKMRQKLGTNALAVVPDADDARTTRDALRRPQPVLPGA